MVTCCSLINALERGGQWQLAEKLFMQMCTVQVGGGWQRVAGQGGQAAGRRVVRQRPLQGRAVQAPGRTLPPQPPLPWPTLPQGDEVPGSLLALPPQGGSPVTPAGKLARAQTSPSSVLDALNSPPARAGGLPQLVSAPLGVRLRGAACCQRFWPAATLCSLPPTNPTPPTPPTRQMSIAESPRAQGQGGGAPDHAWGPLSASFGILSATAAGRQDVLGGLGQAASGQGGQGADVEQLSGRFAAAVALERGNSSGGAPADASADPFAAAAHLVSSLRGGTPTSERLAWLGSCGQGQGRAVQGPENQSTATHAPRILPLRLALPPCTCRAGSSHASFAIPENEEAAAPLEPASPAHPPGLRRLGSGPGTMGNGGGGGGCAASPQRPSSGLGRSGSLKRELGIPELEAAQSLRRAMSCYPELSGGDGQGQGESLAGGTLRVVCAGQPAELLPRRPHPANHPCPHLAMPPTP